MFTFLVEDFMFFVGTVKILRPNHQSTIFINIQDCLHFVHKISSIVIQTSSNFIQLHMSYQLALAMGNAQQSQAGKASQPSNQLHKGRQPDRTQNTSPMQQEAAKNLRKREGGGEKQFPKRLKIQVHQVLFIFNQHLIIH